MEPPMPIVVRLAEQDGEQVADVGQLTVNPGDETPVSNSVQELTVGEGQAKFAESTASV